MNEILLTFCHLVIAGLTGFSSALAIPILRETYAPIIRIRRERASGDPEKAAAAHPHLAAGHKSKLHVLWVNLSRPLVLLTRSFICFVLSLYMAL